MQTITLVYKKYFGSRGSDGHFCTIYKKAKMLLRIALVVSNVYMYVHVCWKRVLSYLSKLLQLLAHHFKIVKHIFYNTILQPNKADNDGILMLLFLCVKTYFTFHIM